jgi:hypothetical protein
MWSYRRFSYHAVDQAAVIRVCKGSSHVAHIKGHIFWYRTDRQCILIILLQQVYVNICEVSAVLHCLLEPSNIRDVPDCTGW